MDAMWERVADPKDTTELRVALLDALASTWGAMEPAHEARRARALGWLRACTPESSPYGLHEAVVRARGQLGDLEAADALAELSYDPWRHRALAGEEGVAALVGVHGLEAVLTRWGADDLAQMMRRAPQARARHLAVRLCEGTGALVGLAPEADHTEALLLALEDPAPAVADRARHALRARAVSADVLWAFADVRRDAVVRAVAEAPPPPLVGPAAAAVSALVLLHDRAAIADHDRSEDGAVQKRDAELYDWLMETGQPIVPLPSIPERVRHAVLREYLPGQRETDPRFLLEGILLAVTGVEADHTLMQLGREAQRVLRDAGVPVGEPTPVGAARQQGYGTYTELSVDDRTLLVCELDRFVRSWDALPDAAARALESAGFTFIDDDLAARVVHGLPVYFFGRREPLRVHDLLFYWQD